MIREQSLNETLWSLSMDTGSGRIRKTIPRHSDKSPPVPEISVVEIDGNSYNLVDIRATGDVLLEVTFENCKSSLKLVSNIDAAPRGNVLVKHAKNPNNKVLYRVRLETLKKTSKYFELLLDSDKFAEGSAIATKFASLRIRDILPSEAEPQELPRIAIIDDDDPTRIAGREAVFRDLLHILHGGEVSTRLTIPYLATLAVMADRFDCTSSVARYVKSSRRLPWPQTYGNGSSATEEVLRQKILISWLLDDPVKLASATRELILRGSLRWSGTEENSPREQQATWWDLQDGLEAEIHHRRICILSTISSLQSYFLALYISKERQCKQFYDSSAACDSFQLGEMIKFFSHKGLLVLLSPLSSNEEFPEAYGGDIENLITVLRQCPSYQIDQNHGHCGLRTRIIPALDYIQAMLSSNIGINSRGWRNDRKSSTWGGIDKGEPFRFTRSVSGDPRLRMEGSLMADKYAKALFTASNWNWNPEV